MGELGYPRSPPPREGASWRCMATMARRIEREPSSSPVPTAALVPLMIWREGATRRATTPCPRRVRLVAASGAYWRSARYWGVTRGFQYAAPPAPGGGAGRSISSPVGGAPPRPPGLGGRETSPVSP